MFVLKKDVRLEERCLKQAHRYVLLHSDEIKELKDEGYGSTSTSVVNNSTEVDNMKAKMVLMQKENQDLRAKFDESNSRVDQSNKILLQTLQAIRTGYIPDDFIEEAQLALRTSNSQHQLVEIHMD